MTDEKLVELVQKIEARTGTNKVKALQWEKTVVEEEFQTTLSSFVIRIRHEFRDGSDDYTISIVGNDGATLESVTDSELSKIVRESHNQFFGIRSFELMEKIFKNAKRQALGVDRAIDNILSELE